MQSQTQCEYQYQTVLSEEQVKYLCAFCPPENGFIIQTN